MLKCLKSREAQKGWADDAPPPAAAAASSAITPDGFVDRFAARPAGGSGPLTDPLPTLDGRRPSTPQRGARGKPRSGTPTRAPGGKQGC